MAERGREVNSSRGTSGKACWRIHSEPQIVGWGLLPRTLDSAAIRTIFQIPKCSAAIFFWSCSEPQSFLTKLYLPVRVAVGRRIIQWKKNNKKQQLEIAFYSDGHLGSEALLPIPKVPPLLSLLYLYALSSLFFYSVCPTISEPQLQLCPQAQSQIDMLNSQLGH